LACPYLELATGQNHLAWARLELATSHAIPKSDQFGSLALPSEARRGNFGLWPVPNGYKRFGLFASLVYLDYQNNLNNQIFSFGSAWGAFRRGAGLSVAACPLFSLARSSGSGCEGRGWKLHELSGILLCVCEFA